VPVIPSRLLEPLSDQFAACCPLGRSTRRRTRSAIAACCPLGRSTRRRTRSAIAGGGSRPGSFFEKLLQVLRFGCPYAAIADASCSPTAIRGRPDEWIEAGIFARFKQIALDAYDRIAGLVLQEILVDGRVTKAPGGGECAGRSPVDRGKQGMKCSGMTNGCGIPLKVSMKRPAPVARP
jgi:hypothetical protein